MEAQRTDWVDAIRYFRGLGRSRRRSLESVVFTAAVMVLAALTVLATLDQFS